MKTENKIRRQNRWEMNGKGEKFSSLMSPVYRYFCFGVVEKTRRVSQSVHLRWFACYHFKRKRKTDFPFDECCMWNSLTDSESVLNALALLSACSVLCVMLFYGTVYCFNGCFVTCIKSLTLSVLLLLLLLLVPSSLLSTSSPSFVIQMVEKRIFSVSHFRLPSKQTCFV